MANGTGLAPAKTFRNLLTAEPFQQMLNRFFEETFRPLLGEEPVSLAAWIPSCDIYETENEIVVKAEVPGIKKENLKVSVHDNVLTLSGERKFEEEVKKENFLRVERGYGSFTRSFTLPPNIDSSKINAEFKDGVLELKLPKAEESKQKSVEIKVK